MSLQQTRTTAVLAATLALALSFSDRAHASTVPDAAARNHGKMLVITGAGDGHGVGMSQEGAYGLAVHGYSDMAILAHYYSGTAIGHARRGTIVRVLVGSKVRRIPLERYVRGVVAAEVPSTWPAAALEAQAIASRTYALTSDAGGARFQVYADSRSQVYEGRAGETARTNAAVAATAGQVVTYAGRPAVTYFFASSGGMTEDVQDGFPGAEPEPWLRGVVDPYDQGPLHRWRVTMSFASAAARLGGLVRGSLRGIEVLERGYSPRVVRAAILGSNGSTQVSGPELAARLGLSATWAYFSVQGPRGAHAEPDASHYHAPQGTPPGSASPPENAPSGGAGGPATNPQGGAPAGEASVLPASRNGGAVAAAQESIGGGTPTE
jgi:stage II sporulation protein D